MQQWLIGLSESSSFLVFSLRLYRKVLKKFAAIICPGHSGGSLLCLQLYAALTKRLTAAFCRDAWLDVETETETGRECKKGRGVNGKNGSRWDALAVFLCPPTGVKKKIMQMKKWPSEWWLGLKLFCGLFCTDRSVFCFACEIKEEHI